MVPSTPSDWPLRPLSDWGRWLSGGTPRKSREDFWGGDIPWVSSKDLYVRYVRDTGLHVTEDGAANGTRLVEAGTLLVVVRSMALAHGLMAAMTTRAVTFNQDVKAIVPADDVLPQFLLFAFWGHASGIRGLIDEASHGTKRLSTELLAAFEMPLPPIDEQRRIAGVLGALDAKIEHDQQLSDTLLRTSAELFEHVCRQAAANGTPSASLSELVQVNPKVAIAKGETTRFLEMASTDAWAVRPRVLTERPYSGGCKFEPRDTLLAKITGCIEYGKGAFVDFVDEAAAGSTEFLVLRAGDRLTPESVFLLTRQDRVRAHLIRRMVGSSGRQRVPVDAFDSLEVVVPESLASWHGEAKFIEVAFARGKAAWESARRLRAVRDELLPKLVTGELRVAEDYDPDATPALVG